MNGSSPDLRRQMMWTLAIILTASAVVLIGALFIAILHSKGA
jgi:hypothetical protein